MGIFGSVSVRAVTTAEYSDDAREIFVQGVFEPECAGRSAPRYGDVLGIGGERLDGRGPQQAAQRGVVHLDGGILTGAESCRQHGGE